MSDTVDVDIQTARDAVAILGALASIVAAIQPAEPSDYLTGRITDHAEKVRATADALGTDIDSGYLKASTNEWLAELESLLRSGTLRRPARH